MFKINHVPEIQLTYNTLLPEKYQTLVRVQGSSSALQLLALISKVFERQ